MKQSAFITKLAKAIAANEIPSGVIRRLLMEVASTGTCRPCWELKRSYSDHTQQVINYLESLGVQKQGTCINGVNIRRGWLLKNDAPRGGKCGNIIVINFDL
jgi:hypothetical protein